MSQIIIPVTSGSLPPTVPTSFSTQDGIATPSANVLIINGIDSIENNNNGIITKGGIVGTGTVNEVDVVITNRSMITQTTTNATPLTINVLTPPPSVGFTMILTVNGYDSSGNATTGGEQIAIATSSSLGNVVIVGVNDTFEDSSASLLATDWGIVTDGTNIQIQLIGVAATTINWVCLFQYIQSPSP